MKNIIKIIILLFSFQLNAQTIKPSEQYYTADYNDLDNIYFKDINHIYDKFLGTWEYSNGSHYLKIIVTKVLRHDNGVTNTGKRIRTRKQYLDYINIDYIYKYNGVTVYNVIPPYQMVNGRVVASSIDGHIINNVNQVQTFYNEPSTTTCMRNRHGKLKLTYLANSTPQLHWERTDKLTQNPDSYCTNGVFDNSPYKIPANIILTKIN